MAGDVTSSHLVPTSSPGHSHRPRPLVPYPVGDEVGADLVPPPRPGLSLEELADRTGRATGDDLRHLKAALAEEVAEGRVKILADGRYALVPGAVPPELAEALEWISGPPTPDSSSGVQHGEVTALGWAARRIAELRPYRRAVA